MIHHAIAIEGNTEQNLQIWLNLICSFRSWLFWTLTLRCLGYSFNVITIHPWFVTSSSSKSGSSLNIINISWEMSMQFCFCSIFSNFGTVFAATRFITTISIKIDCHAMIGGGLGISEYLGKFRDWPVLETVHYVELRR